MPNNHKQPVYLVIRYDDYGAAYLPSCAARFSVEQMIDREVSARGWSWLCGITPRQSVDPHNVHEQRTVSLEEDAARIQLIRRSVADGVCEPAVHGLTHHTWKQLPRYGTEFSGLPIEQQFTILQTAKRETEEVVQRPVHVLIPPWNSFDEGTVRAAAKVGFEVLSGSVRTFLRTEPPTRLVPATVEPFHLRQIMDRGQRFPNGSVIVLLLHATDFVTVDERIGYLREADFGPLLDRAVATLGMEVVPIAGVPGLIGPDLERRVERAVRLFGQFDSLAAMPILGRRFQRWMLPYVSALPPSTRGATIRVTVATAIGLWFALVIAAAIVPALLVGGVIADGALRSAAWSLLALGGMILTGYSGRNAVLKRFRSQWGGGEVGLRTWTGVVSGCAFMASGVARLVMG